MPLRRYNVCFTTREAPFMQQKVKMKLLCIHISTNDHHIGMGCWFNCPKSVIRGLWRSGS